MTGAFCRTCLRKPRDTFGQVAPATVLQVTLSREPVCKTSASAGTPWRDHVRRGAPLRSYEEVWWAAKAARKGAGSMATSPT